ncbi:hypothetical protein SETIT_2G034500v2 [Setaria italica]|uniref:Protein TIFY n=1 Tax=Setaria italica TaxID=4555 RepID=A0A368PUP0_SETIT|nr:protein TIFY 5 isoform X1 [Setaria italica]RCV09501.1 hypothetical protein SETIT_2G034500v2 [Setaria italica]
MEEGWKEVAAGAGRRWRRRSGGKGGDSGDESDGSSGGGGVELSLRLRTGDSTSVPPPAPMAVAEEERHQAAAAAEAEGRRNMTIFYNGRVCAVDVTEVQARAIISMANEEMIMAAAADHHRQQHRHLQDSGSSSSAHVRPAEVAPAAGPSSSRQGFAAVAAAPVIDQQVVSGLSMKRSLQLFLQKRKARAGGAVAPPYAGGRHAQAIMRH